MTPGDFGVPVDVLRAAAQRRADETNLRTAAAEIGLSYSGLRTFLKGTGPYTPTVEKLRTWFATTEAGKVETARAALAFLVDGLPPAEREEAEREIRAVLRKKWKGQGGAPEWIGE